MPDPRKVYFGNLPLHFPERDVETIAEAAGKVRSVAVRNDESRRKAYAFVEYEDDKDAETSVKTLDGKEVDGARISVEHYRGGRRERDSDRGGDRGGRRRGGGPSKTLFVGNLHENTNERGLRDEFDRFGTVREIRLGQRRAPDGRQHAFVEFEEIRSAEDAFNKMRNGEIQGLPIRIDYDVGFISGGGPDRGGRRGGGGGDRYAPYPRAGGRHSRSPPRYRRDSRERRRSPDRRRRDDSRDRRDRRRDDSRDRRDRSRTPDRRRRDDSPPRRDSRERK